MLALASLVLYYSWKGEELKWKNLPKEDSYWETKAFAQQCPSLPLVQGQSNSKAGGWERGTHTHTIVIIIYIILHSEIYEWSPQWL